MSLAGLDHYLTTDPRDSDPDGWPRKLHVCCEGVDGSICLAVWEEGEGPACEHDPDTCLDVLEEDEYAALCKQEAS